MTTVLEHTDAQVRLAPRANIGGRESISVFHRVTGDAIRSCERFKVRIVLYGAKDACGLMSNDRNGIAVLCQTRKTVICDELFFEPMGTQFGPSQAQVDAFSRMLSMPEDELEDLINQSPRLRMPL